MDFKTVAVFVWGKIKSVFGAIKTKLKAIPEEKWRRWSLYGDAFFLIVFSLHWIMSLFIPTTIRDLWVSAFWLLAAILLTGWDVRRWYRLKKEPSPKGMYWL